MLDQKTLDARRIALLKSTDPKYTYRFAPDGFVITKKDRDELEKIGTATVDFLSRIKYWYDSREGRNHVLSGVLRKGYPKIYNGLSSPASGRLPTVAMIDTVWTRDGWRLVELDATNRNAYGYPNILRELYGLPTVFGDVATAFADWEGMVQIMGDQYRFYEPYYRAFLGRIGGTLIPEAEVSTWLRTAPDNMKLLDLPPLYHLGGAKRQLVERAAHWRIAIPPFHWMASKALFCAFEMLPRFSRHPLRAFVPETHMVTRRSEVPRGSFFVKLIQSGGAHGTFLDDAARFEVLRMSGGNAIWQPTLPIERRPITILDNDGRTRHELFVRCSIFVETATGRVVDADVTVSDSPIVHGGKTAAMTVPVLCDPMRAAQCERDFPFDT